MAGDSPLNTQVNPCNDCNKMAESATQDESIALYRFMCENIVGSEEHMKTIRVMNNVRNNLQNVKQCTLITSGSFGEGLTMKGSDLDIVKVVKGDEICEDANIRFKHGTVYFIMQSEDTKPGYTKLLLYTKYLLYTEDPRVLKNCKQIGCDYFYSNILFKQNFTNHSGVIVHGPCISDNRGILDAAYCLHSKSWITPAKQWITRSKKSWLTFEVKQLILKHGLLFVPVREKGSKTEELEWRISFSYAEKLLVYTFTHTQLLCYALMKIFLNDVIPISCIHLNVSDLICSYSIKTLMFWMSEELPSFIWKPDNLISCFMRCLRRLIHCVKFYECPHYFIPSNNLFKHKIKGRVQELLLEQLNILHRSGWKCILLSKQMSKFDTLTYDINSESHFLHVRSFEAFLCSRNHFADNIPCTNTLILEKGIHRAMYTKSSKFKFLYTYYTSQICVKGDELLPFDGISNNKSTYKQYITSVFTLLIGTRNDDVSGWLLFALFFYNRRNYETADYILQHCISKCPSDKLYQGTKLSPFNSELFYFNLSRELTSV